MNKLTTLALVLVAACAAQPIASTGGGDDDGPNPGGPDGGTGTSTLTVQAFIETLVTQECTHAISCRAQYPASTGDTFEDEYGTDQADCVSSDTDYGQRDAIAAAVTAGKMTWNPSIGDTCAADLQFPATCPEFFSTWDWPASCYDALAGNVADGAACITDWECSGDTSDCTAGKCTPAT